MKKKKKDFITVPDVQTEEAAQRNISTILRKIFLAMITVDTQILFIIYYINNHLIVSTKTIHNKHTKKMVIFHVSVSV